MITVIIFDKSGHATVSKTATIESLKNLLAQLKRGQHFKIRVEEGGKRHSLYCENADFIDEEIAVMKCAVLTEKNRVIREFKKHTLRGLERIRAKYLYQ